MARLFRERGVKLERTSQRQCMGYQPHPLEYKQTLAAAIIAVGGQRADVFDVRIRQANDHAVSTWQCP
jgi:hypothetical protein